MRSANRLHSCFRKTEVLDLAFVYQILHRAGHVFDWHVGINTMLVEQIDNIGPESFERSFSDFFDVLWPAIETDLLTFGTKLETELGSDHHFLTERSKRFAHEFFIRERTVHFGSIEERDASFDGCSNQRDHLLLFFRRTVAKTHSHTAEAD